MVYGLIRRAIGYLDELSSENTLDQIYEMLPKLYESLLTTYNNEGKKPFQENKCPTALINAIERRAVRIRLREYEKLEGKINSC